MKARLYRSQTDRMLGGVCGGIGHYLGVDPVIVRLIFVVVVLTGPGILIYPILWAIVPPEGQGDSLPGETIGAGASEMAEQARTLGHRLGSGSRDNQSLRGMFLGGFLVLLGFTLLIDNLHITWLRWLNMELIWPVVLILLGIALVQRRTRTAQLGE